MFLKPYKLKNNAPLKSSDVKRLRQQLETTFPNVTVEQLQMLLPPKAAVTLLRLSTPAHGMTQVYCVDKLPLFFKTGAAGENNQDRAERLVPTLYAMWQVPELLPYFTTIPAVLPRLSNGADLMLPGVVLQSSGMNRYGRHKRGQLVAVNLTSNAAAVGVGFLPRSSDDLFMCGGQGTAVKMLHLFGDKLWGHEPALAQQVPNLRPSDLTRDDFPTLGADPKKARAEKSAAAPTLADIVAETKAEEVQVAPAAPLPDIAKLEITSNGDKSTPQTDDPTTTTTTPSPTSAELTPEQVLKNAFLAALKNHGKTLQLPLLTSNFYRLYVVNEATQDIDLKKTRYKKLSNFLAEMIDQGFLVVREETKGVDKITSIDLEHPELVNFITDFKRPNGATAGDDDDEPAPLFHSELTELYIVSDVTAAFFTRMNYKRGEGIPAGQIKKIIREYISKHSLPIADKDSRAVRLDETLAALCDQPTATPSQICFAIQALMEHTYQMCSVKDVSANKPLIQMSLATRSGNKKVTLVSNVGCYGIIVPEFIKLCKQGAAASTTIVKLPHQKSEQLQIQGNQVRFVHTLLTETYKVPPKCILGLELAKDGKKHKKK